MPIKMTKKVTGIIERVYEDPGTHWMMVLVDCDAKDTGCPLHLFRVAELPLRPTELQVGSKITISTEVEVTQKSRYGWSLDPQTDEELQEKYGDSIHRPKP